MWNANNNGDNNDASVVTRAAGDADDSIFRKSRVRHKNVARPPPKRVRFVGVDAFDAAVRDRRGRRHRRRRRRRDVFIK